MTDKNLLESSCFLRKIIYGVLSSDKEVNR